MSQALVASEGQQPDLLSSYLGNLGLPAFIVTTFFPSLFGKVSKYPRTARLLTIPLVLWLASNFVISKLYALWRKMMSNAMASVIITSDDFYLYAAFKSWLSKQKLWMLERAISAQSIFYLRNKGQDGRTIEKELANNKSIVFDPQNKFQLFRYQRRFFLLTMDTRQMLHTSTDRTEMKIWCLGLSPQPIENMLLDIYDASRTQESRTLTTIMTPYSGRQWNRRCIKPARPLSSVYMEPAEKDKLLEDMTEYLAPTTAKWYQDRGIPYRRGYLFHGSPGCGKTSLAVALAGHFRLDVYIVSLLDLEISDSALLQLFQAVRSGVLVLLEDVDSAGLGREVANEPATPTMSSSHVTPAAAMLSDKKRARLLQTSRITLSGLLNAIDGAGAPEGHILVMTTNTPDALDEALVRPGRVDVKVEFSKASTVQVREIFVNMYRPAPSFVSEKTPIDGEVETEIEKEERKQAEMKEERDAEELQEFAERFAEKVPEGRFSPAELQDYILLRKDQPLRAVEEIAGWVARELGLKDEQNEEGRAETGKKKAGKRQKKSKEATEVKTKEPKRVPDEVDADAPKEVGSGQEVEYEKTTGGADDASAAPYPSEPRSPSSESDSGSDEESEEGESPASSVGEDAGGDVDVANDDVTSKEEREEKAGSKEGDNVAKGANTATEINETVTEEGKTNKAPEI